MSPPASLAHSALTLVAMSLAVTLLSQLLRERPLAALLLGALAVDFLAGRARVGWSLEAGSRGKVLLGCAVGAAAAGGAAMAGWLMGHLRIVLWGMDPVGVLTGVLAALALAFRDELWLRWAPWHLLEGHVSPWIRAGVVVALGVAAGVGEHGLRVGALGVAAQGALSITLLCRTRSFPALVAASFALRLVANPTPLGIELRWVSGSLASLGAASGPGVWWLVAALVTMTLAILPAAFNPRGADRTG
ncbi:MAG: hypothetical protein RMJ98_07940 [Myxococcales bacterium]|nr:hypothetical protein [Polyangiaceae bacterium]MDW8249216.1 hypothetical protein [Myxococcales bacterium]